MIREHHTSSNSTGITTRKLVLSLVVSAIFLVLLVIVIRSGSQATPSRGRDAHNLSTPTQSVSGQYSILAPATVPPKVPECSTQITYDANGDSGPITCPNGDLNILEWNALSALEPKVMTLGYSPSASQVSATLCSDASDSNSDSTTKDSFIIETTTYQISALYYGWTFPSNPSAVLDGGKC